MVLVKRIYTFMLQRFIPVFIMTFFITLFIVMMQFLFRYINDLVGKGLGFDVIGELFFYAALSMVPTALPLAVLLASLMTFGNLGEKFELTAMKASGISLFRIMRSLIVLIVFVAVGAFFFQNDVLPMAQTKMWTLMFSIRQKSPEVEIPEKSFYNQIPNMNLYVDHKNTETGRLDGLIIYDTSRGNDKVRVILADSGRISFTEDKSRICFQLFNGEMYEDFRDNVMGSSSGRYMPFRRETFDTKTAYIAYDANFNRMNDSTMRQQYIGKNITELRVAIDSIQTRVDSVSRSIGTDIKEQPYLSLPYYETRLVDHKSVKSVRHEVNHAPLNIDSLLKGETPQAARANLSGALMRVKRWQNEIKFKGSVLMEEQKNLRRHQIEMHKKFTLSLACLVFFFIGAPLGAIIKKGGLGMPLVISVILFIVYYIFDNTGYKMARDGKMDVIAGIWLSTFVMLPLGIFFTWKAVGDTTMFDFDMYKRFFRNIRRRLGKKYKNDKTFTMKEISINDVDPIHAISLIEAADDSLQRYKKKRGRFIFFPGILRAREAKKELRNRLADMTDYLSDTRDHEVIALMNMLPVLIEPRTTKHIDASLAGLKEHYRPSETPDLSESSDLSDSSESSESSDNSDLSDSADNSDLSDSSENSESPQI